MKKFLSILMIFAVLLSCCACGEKKTEDAGAAADVAAAKTPEAMYGHIDQTQPLDGFYKIWNAEGVKFMMENHPEGRFELLCNIDMEGATLAPIQEFTGMIKGGNFTISNFVLQGGSEESFGFAAVNKGSIQNILFENVTFAPGANAKNIGSLAGINDGKLNRCVISGTMEVTKAAANAACGSVAGANTGTIANTVATVDTVYSAPGAAYVGGLIGVAKGGTVEFTESHGALTITGADKITGLFAGDATDVIFSKCVFGGADNSLDGKYFTNFTGNSDDDERVVAEAGLWRDNACIEPVSEKVAALRQRVVDEMYKIKTVTWHVKEDLVHSCTCQMSTCHGTYSTKYTYVGVPYNHKANSYRRAMYCLNEDNTPADWFYDLSPLDGFDIYFGSDCSSTVQQAWWTVSNSSNIQATDTCLPAYGYGTIPVGDYKCDFQMTKQERDGVNTLYTAEYLEANSEQTIYEAYADMHPGDAIVNRVAAGGHTRMIASEPVVIRDQDGNIDPAYSYVISHEQGGESVDDVNMVVTFGKINYKYTFAQLYGTCYVPFTCEELITGEMETPEATLEGGCDGYAGMFTGTVKANYHLDFITLNIVDSDGETVFEHPFFPTVQKRSDFGNNNFTQRHFTSSADICDFATVLTKAPLEHGESYSYTLTVSLTTYDDFVVHQGEFTYG